VFLTSRFTVINPHFARYGPGKYPISYVMEELSIWQHCRNVQS